MNDKEKCTFHCVTDITLGYEMTDTTPRDKLLKILNTPSDFVSEPHQLITLCHQAHNMITALIRRITELEQERDEAVREYEGTAKRECYAHGHRRGRRIVLRRGDVALERLRERGRMTHGQWAKAICLCSPDDRRKIEAHVRKTKRYVFPQNDQAQFREERA